MRHIRKLGSLVLSAAAGVGVGILTGKLFVPLIQMGYFSTDQVLPLPIIRDTGDDLRLGNHLGRHHDRLYGDSGHSDFPDADCTDAEAGGGLSMGELLTARDVSKGFPLAGGETFWALKHINLSIPAGKLKKAKKETILPGIVSFYGISYILSGAEKPSRSMQVSNTRLARPMRAM